MIFAAAIQHDGVIYTLPQPNRHSDILSYMRTCPGNGGCGMPTPIRGETQGFITDQGVFLNRRHAAVHAKEHGQVKELRFQKHELFSEDLW